MRDYLLNYGSAGDFGPFHSEEPLACRRGDRVVVRSHRGQELGVVMRPATEEHARLLEGKFVGQILSLKYRVLVTLHDLALNAPEISAEKETEGCGLPGCGAASGGCNSCSSGGCGTCTNHVKQAAVASADAVAVVHPDRVQLL